MIKRIWAGLIQLEARQASSNPNRCDSGEPIDFHWHAQAGLNAMMARFQLIGARLSEWEEQNNHQMDAAGLASAESIRSLKWAGWLAGCCCWLLFPYCGPN